MKCMRIFGILFVALLVVSAQAYATPTLRLTQGVNVVTITDGEVDGGGDDDANGAANVVTWVGAIGTYDINVTTGLDDPAGAYIMDLNSVNTTGSGGDLLIEFSEIGYTDAPLAFVVGFGGTINGNGTVTGTGSVDQQNVLFGAPEGQCSVGPLTGNFAASCSFGVSTKTPYSLTTSVLIRFTGAGTYSGDLSVTQVPEPASMFLVGSGILAGLRYRRKKAAR